MRLRDTFTLLWIILLIPATAVGAYLSYTQARTRVEELNQITPLSDTDIQQALEWTLGLEDPEPVEAAPIGGTPVADLIVEAADTNETSSVTIDSTAEPFVEATPNPENNTAGDDPVVETAALPDVETVAAAPLDPRRVTVLLMGIDQRQGETGQFRTDTMILLSLDPVAKTGAMLSIPRDLWVSIPGGFGQNRINTANYIGDDPQHDYPGGGPALAMLAIEKVVGVPIDHYIQINFDAFYTLIEAVGPIEICVKELIDDPKYPDGSYGYLPIRIEPGCQEMPAERLLQYARTRATANGDFDRAARQQEVILEVREKILSGEGIRSLITDALPLWESVSANIRTDMTLDEIIQLGLIAQDITDIRSETIGAGEVLPGTTDDGSEILIPIQSDIMTMVSNLFRPPVVAAGVPGSGSTLVVDPNNIPLAVREEAAIIGVLNGTNTRGLASNLEKYILSQNLDVGTVGNHSSTDVVTSFVIYYGDHVVSANYVAQALAPLHNNEPLPVQRGEGTRPEGDVLVIIGTDLNIPTPPQ